MFLLLGVATGCGTKSSSGTGSGTNSKSDSSQNSPVISVGASQAGSAGVPADTSGNPAPVELETMLNAILGATPGTAGSSMKQARAAGELLDWAQAGNLADTGALERWLDINSVSQETELATAYGAVLDFADRVLAGDETSAGALSDAGYMLSHVTHRGLMSIPNTVKSADYLGYEFLFVHNPDAKKHQDIVLTYGVTEAKRKKYKKRL